MGLFFSELHAWTLLSTRTIVGCAFQNVSAYNDSVAIGTTNSTLKECAALGLFECRPTLEAVTQVPSGWITGLFLTLLVVVSFWFSVAWTLSCQNWRAGHLLPHGIFVRVKEFNASFYSTALILTCLYIYVKYAAFSSQPKVLQMGGCGVSGGLITAHLSDVFPPVDGTGSGGLLTLGSNLVALWLAFSSMSALVSRYASDAFADVTLTQLLVCSSSTGGGPCQSHDVGEPSHVLSSLTKPFLHLTSSQVDAALHDWYTQRGLKGRGLHWHKIRWLLKCDPVLVADAATWLKSSRLTDSSGSPGNLQ